MADETESDVNDDKPSTRQRSTIGFPYMDLKSAITLADAIHQNVGTGDCDDDQLAAWTNQSSKSSTFRVQISAARMFGVLEGDARHRLSELGRQLVDPNQTRAARARAFLNVPLYRAVFDKYKGGVIPPALAFERDIVQLGVAEKQSDRARQAFERSAEQAGYFEHGRNRLVAPGVLAEQSGGGAPPPADNNGNGDGNNGGAGKGNAGKGGDVPAHVDPLIAALIQKLPAGGKWEAAQRVTWLQMISMAFQLSYGADADIEIKLKPKESPTSPT